MKPWTTGFAALLAAVAVPTALVVTAPALYSDITDRSNAAAATKPVVQPPAPRPTTTLPPTTTTTPPPPPPPPPPGLSPAQQQALAAQVQSAVRGRVPGAAVGLEVLDQQTGQLVTSLNADRQFAAMSVVKLLIAVDVLARNNWAPPDPTTSQNVRQMLAASDDDLASDYWDEDGGGDLITRDAALMGLHGTEPPADPGEWGDTPITAADMVSVYRYITGAMPEPARDIITSALAAAPQTAADGTDQYFGIPDGLPGHPWGVKQGWGTSGSTALFNTTGLVGPGGRYVVVLLASAPASAYGTLPRAVTAGTSQLNDALH